MAIAVAFALTVGSAAATAKAPRGAHHHGNAPAEIARAAGHKIA